MENLFLQVFCVCGDDDFCVVFAGVIEGGKKVRHGFSRACAGFDDLMSALCERLSDFVFDFYLRFACFKVGNSFC